MILSIVPCCLGQVLTYLQVDHKKKREQYCEGPGAIVSILTTHNPKDFHIMKSTYTVRFIMQVELLVAKISFR